jgi:hypothetical protein
MRVSRLLALPASHQETVFAQRVLCEAPGSLKKTLRPTGAGWPYKLCHSRWNADYFRHQEIVWRSASLSVNTNTALLKECMLLAKSVVSGKGN